MKILVIRLSSIGDIIQASGLPRHLHEKFPQAPISWVVRSDNESLLANNPYVTQVISFDRGLGLTGWLRLCGKLRAEGFTHVYDAHNNWRSHILCWILKPRNFVRRSKERFRRFLIFWLKMRSLQKVKTGVESYIAPLKKWGITNDGKGSEIFLTPAFTENVKQILKNASVPLDDHLVALAPAAAWPKKTWPQAYWESLIKVLLQKTPYHFLILGGPQDDFCKNLVLDPKRVFSMQGKLSLLESAAAISFCKTLLAADTGLLHMAESLGKDVVCLRGPTHLGFTARPGSITLTKNLWCQPCSKDGRGICINKTYQKCMTDISVLEVYETLQRVL